MEVKKIKFKPLSAKVINVPGHELRFLQLDYIYQGGVFSISKEIKENKYFVSADLQLDLVLLYFGGFKSIEENTLKLIKEENDEPKKSK